VASTSAGESSSKEGEIPKGFGRIIRDEEGNVIDIILAEEGDEEAVEEDGDAVMEPEESRNVEAKTDVVRCESFSRTSDEYFVCRCMLPSCPTERSLEKWITGFHAITSHNV